MLKADLANATKLLANEKKDWDTCSAAATKENKKTPVIWATCQVELLEYLEAKADYDELKPSLNSGAVAGIIIGCCLGAIGISINVWCCYHKK